MLMVAKPFQVDQSQYLIQHITDLIIDPLGKDVIEEVKISVATLFYDDNVECKY